MQAQNKYERLFKTLSIYFLPFRINSCWLEKINTSAIRAKKTRMLQKKDSLSSQKLTEW
jgi:hypothetical protein